MEKTNEILHYYPDQARRTPLQAKLLSTLGPDALVTSDLVTELFMHQGSLRLILASLQTPDDLTDFFEARDRFWLQDSPQIGVGVLTHPSLVESALDQVRSTDDPRFYGVRTGYVLPPEARAMVGHVVLSIPDHDRAARYLQSHAGFKA